MRLTSSEVISTLDCSSAPATSEPAWPTPGALEQSNVEMTSELVSLMTSQRNYQANTKVFQTQNQIMQSLMQAI